MVYVMCEYEFESFGCAVKFSTWEGSKGCKPHIYWADESCWQKKHGTGRKLNCVCSVIHKELAAPEHTFLPFSPTHNLA